MSSHQCCMVNALHDVVYNIGVSGGDLGWCIRFSTSPVSLDKRAIISTGLQGLIATVRIDMLPTGESALLQTDSLHSISLW